MLVSGCGRSAEEQPYAPATPQFVGSDTCSGCHAGEFGDWQGSHHQLAMQPASAASVLGDFGDATFEYFEETTRFTKSAGRFVVRTPGPDGAVQDVVVRYTFGVEPIQQYLVELPGGRLQALPFLWDTRDRAAGGQRWLHLYGDEHIAPPDALHWSGREQNWNFMCAECHSTDVVMNYDAATDTFDTRYTEISVGCEACHGPGSRHVDAARRGETAGSRYGLVVDLDDRGRAVWQMDSESGIAARSEARLQPPVQPEACGRCHARRGLLTDRYEYGRPLADTHQPALLIEPLYFADGQIRDEVYVYGSFLQSRMYRAGVSCSDCHNPHSLELVTGDDPNAVCAQCHLPTIFAEPSHSHHGSGVGCIDCHMPARTYMRVDERRDHSFRVPRPDLGVVTGSPNTCNGCHAERSAEWATAAVERWFGRSDRPHWAYAVESAGDVDANSALLDVLSDTTLPGIARATAVTLLSDPLGPDEARAIVAALRDADPLIRLGALRAHRYLPGDVRLQAGSELLADRVRGVRIEAALAYADVHQYLEPAARRAFENAANEFRYAQTIQLNRPEAHVALGDFARATGSIETALGHYDDALALESRSTLARVNLADTLRQIGDEPRARRVLEAGLALAPDAAALHHSLGLLLVRIDEHEAALDALREAVRLAPDDRRFRYVLDVAESELGQAGDDQADTDDEQQRINDAEK